MNSPFANLFLALQAHIATIVDGASKQMFPHIDHDFNQLSVDQPPVSWPCVLIDFENFDFSDIGSNCQLGRGLVTVKIGFKPYSNTSVNTPTLYKQKGLNYYEQEQALHQALQGWTPTGLEDIFGSLARVNARTDKRREDIRIRSISYSIGEQDYSTKQGLTYVPATLDLTDEFDV